MVVRTTVVSAAELEAGDTADDDGVAEMILVPETRVLSHLDVMVETVKYVLVMMELSEVVVAVYGQVVV